MNLFVYGTLISEIVWKSVVRRPYESDRAILKDYARKKIQSVVYPGLLPCPGSRVEGKVYFNILEDDRELLDKFEGERYERIEVTVECGAEAAPLACNTYLFKSGYYHRLLSEDWSYEDFARSGITLFLSTYPGF